MYCGPNSFDHGTFHSADLCCACDGGCEYGEECPPPCSFDWWTGDPCPEDDGQAIEGDNDDIGAYGEE